MSSGSVVTSGSEAGVLLLSVREASLLLFLFRIANYGFGGMFCVSVVVAIFWLWENLPPTSPLYSSLKCFFILADPLFGSNFPVISRVVNYH